MSRVEVFEPALCCATGICGEDVDQQLVAFSADLDIEESTTGAGCCSSDGPDTTSCC